MDHHFLPHHTSHTPQMPHPSSQHGQVSQHQQPLTRPSFPEQATSTQQQSQQGHGQGNQAQSQQGQGQQPPQIRSRITVVCAECKRLKLRCDRRSPCGSCTKRDTVQRCIYSPAAAEKVDLHSLNNRLIQVEAALAMITSGQFESVYPGVRELIESVRGTGGMTAGPGSGGSGGQSGCVGPHGSSAQSQGDRVEGYGQQQLGPQIQSTQFDFSSHAEPMQRDANDIHSTPHQHTHQHHHHHSSAPAQAYSTSSSFKALARDCARVIDPESGSVVQVTEGEQSKRGVQDDGSGGQTQLIKLEPSPSDLGFVESRSPSPIPFFVSTSQQATSSATIPSTILTSNPPTTPPILLPALSIYYPVPTILPPGSAGPENPVPPFSSDGSFSSSNPLHPQITSALLALLPTGDKCLQWLQLAESTISMRGLPLEVETPRDSQPELSKELSRKSAWESFEERCWPLIGAQRKPTMADGERKERARHRERERRRERDRDKPPGSTATSPTISNGAEQRRKALVRAGKSDPEEVKRAREIYFGGHANASGMPRRRAVDEYREREGLSPSSGSSGEASNEYRISSPPLFRPPARREQTTSMSFHQAIMTAPKRDEPLTFFALMCTVLAIGGMIERAQTAKQTTTEQPPVQPSTSTNILQSADTSISPEFLYALGRQALGVWDTHISSSSSSLTKSGEKERQRLEYILSCCAAANYVLLGLELGVRPDRDGMFDCGESSESDGAEQSITAGREGDEEERTKDESNRRKAGRIIYGLVGKMVNAGRAMGLANDPTQAHVKQESDGHSSNSLSKYVREEWKRSIWWEIVCWDLFVADVFSHQAYISPGSYTTCLPGSQQESEELQSSDTNNDVSDYIIMRSRLVSITQNLQARLARPDCCCGYTLDQAASIEAEVRVFLSQLPESLSLASSKFETGTSVSTPSGHLQRMQTYELAIVANTLLLGVYTPFISSHSNGVSTSARLPSVFGSTLFPTGPGKSAMNVGSSLPSGLANNGNDYDSLTAQPTSNAISAASAKSVSNVQHNDSSLGGHASSGASANFGNSVTDVNPSSGAAPSDSVTLGSAGSGLGRRGRDNEVVDGNFSGVIDMPQLGNHGQVNALAIHASVRAAKSIVLLFENLRDTILDIKAKGNDVLILPALFTFYPAPTTLLNTLLVLARAHGGFSSPFSVHRDSWFAIADSKELLNSIETGLSIIDCGKYFVDRLSKDDLRLLDRLRKKVGEIRDGTALESSTRLTAGAVERFNASHEAADGIDAAGTQHLPQSLKRKHSQVSVGPDAVTGSGSRSFNHEFNDNTLNSASYTSGVTGSAGGRVGEAVMEVLSGSGSNPSFDFGAMERHQAQQAEANLLEHSASLSQPAFAQSGQMQHQPHSLPTFEQHKVQNGHPIAQQQHHSYEDEVNASYPHYSQTRQSSPAPQQYPYPHQQTRRSQEALNERLTIQRQDIVQAQLQLEREKRATEGYEKEKERKSSSGSSTSRKSNHPSVGIRLRVGRDGQVITSSSHSSTSSGKSNDDHESTVVAVYSQKNIDANTAHKQAQHGDGSFTTPSSPAARFRPRSGSMSQNQQAQVQLHYQAEQQQQHSTMAQAQDVATQQHMDFSMSMSHGMPMSSPTTNFPIDVMHKRSYDDMPEQNTSAHPQPQPHLPSFGPQRAPYSAQTYEQNGIHGVFESPESTAQYDRSLDDTSSSSTMISYHNSSPFTNANGAASGSGSPFQINSSGHPTPTFPSHHVTPPVFGPGPPPQPSSAHHASPTNFFHNQFSGHESYANSPVLPTNMPHQHPHPNTLHHQPQPMHSHRNALLDMHLDSRMEQNMVASMPASPVYEKAPLQSLNSFDSKAGVMSELHGMGQHDMSEQMDMSGMGGSGTWADRGPGPSPISVEHHHHQQQQQQQQLHQRHPQDMVSQTSFWNNGPDLKFYQ